MKLLGGQAGAQKGIYDHESMSTFLCLASDAGTVDGVEPHLSIIDELHCHRTGELMGIRRLRVASRRMAATSPFSRLPGTAEKRAWVLWMAFAVVIAILLTAKIKQSGVTATYFPTAATWWAASGDIYTEGIAGYLYLPQSLYLFTPFLAFPEGPVREIAWRLFGFALFAFGIRRVLRRTVKDGGADNFELVTLLVVLATGSSARNGQTNLHLAGLILHACADLIDRRWWRATLLLWGGMLAKPVALVMILLVGALYRSMRLRLLLGLGVFLALPFLHPDPGYALEQYKLGVEKLTRSAQPGTKPYDDLVGVLRTVGIVMPQAVRTGIAMLMALVTLGLAYVGLCRGGRVQGTWVLGALTATYLMLFNPRTETNSYVILVPWLAMLAAVGLFQRHDRRMVVVFVLGCLALGCDNYGRPFHEFTRGFLKPAVACLFLIYLAVRVASLGRRPLLRCLPLFLLLVLVPGEASARAGGPGPQRPIWPPKGKTDRMLYEKACTLQAQMWQHLSPEGLLIVRHRRGASGADLSHDALFRSDACMWTGCYIGAQACRWHVTRDPDALEQVRFLAKGMRALSEVTGTKGAFARNLGRPQTPNAGESTIASHTLPGMRFRPDVSRDQLAGLTLGWYLVGTMMEDAALKALAAQQMRDIALRIYNDKMWIRDHLGNKTKYGELRATVPFLPFVRNGSWAAIGLAPLIAAADLNPTNHAVARALRKLDQGGWDEALAHQNTQITATVNASNVYMITLSLLVIARSNQRKGRPAHYAKKGMRALRHATMGWWNAGTCACYMLGGMPGGIRTLRGEIRATLHGLPDREEPRTLVRTWRAKKAAPIWQRQSSSWYWTNDVTFHHEWKPAVKHGPEVIWTGADWLCAYWLGRAAGEFTPIVGNGVKPREHHIPSPRPAWTR